MVSLQLLFGFLLALFLNLRSSFLEVLRTFFLIPMVLPPIVVAVIWKMMYTPAISPFHWTMAALGLEIPSLIANPDWALTAIIVAEIWQGFPFTMLMVLAALQMMPEEYVEAARIDGANVWQMTLHVTLPFLKGVLLAAGLFRLIDSMKAFPLIYLLTEGGPGEVTEVTNYYSFTLAFNFSFLGYSSAITVILVTMTIVLTWAIVKVVRRGEALGTSGSIAYAERWWRYARHATVLTVLVLVLLPFVWLLVTWFKPNRIIFAIPPVLVFQPTLQNYVDLWQGMFPASFLNSAVVAISTTALSVLIGVPGAYALSRATFRHKEQMSLWILASRMAPPIAFTIPYFLAYRHAGLLDTLTGLIIIYLTFNLSLVVWMMRRSSTRCRGARGGGLDRRRLDAPGVLSRSCCRSSAPGLAATAILCFIYAWNDFFFALILTRTHAMTATVAIVNFMNLEGWEWGKIAAGGRWSWLPVIFSLPVRRYLVAGWPRARSRGELSRLNEVPHGRSTPQHHPDHHRPAALRHDRRARLPVHGDARDRPAGERGQRVHALLHQRRLLRAGARQPVHRLLSAHHRHPPERRQLAPFLGRAPGQGRLFLRQPRQDALPAVRCAGRLPSALHGREQGAPHQAGRALLFRRMGPGARGQRHPVAAGLPRLARFRGAPRRL